MTFGSILRVFIVGAVVAFWAGSETVAQAPAGERPMAANADPGFEVATIKPASPQWKGKNLGFQGHEFFAHNETMNDLIAFAYGLHAKQIVGGPEWFARERWDIQGTSDVEGRPNLHQMALMVQKLLPGRFALKFHHEQRELQTYIFAVAPGGPKMALTTAAPTDQQTFYFGARDDLTVRNMTMKDFATWMQSTVLNRPVVDHTGLTSRFDFELKWTPDNSQFIQFDGTNSPSRPATAEDPDAPPSLYTAMPEQLGLKIESGKAMDDVIVIDHVEKPSAN